MKRTLAAAAATLLLAAGCNSPSEEGKTGGSYEVVTVDVDGRQVPCVIWDGKQAGGITCDWARPA